MAEHKKPQPVGMQVDREYDLVHRLTPNGATPEQIMDSIVPLTKERMPEVAEVVSEMEKYLPVTPEQVAAAALAGPSNRGLEAVPPSENGPYPALAGAARDALHRAHQGLPPGVGVAMLLTFGIDGQGPPGLGWVASTPRESSISLVAEWLGQQVVEGHGQAVADSVTRWLGTESPMWKHLIDDIRKLEREAGRVGLLDGIQREGALRIR